ncbi:DNA polymerase III subunit gamma/tau [Pullulanibacillus sp. KACC 23026]|uniref:DNA polymerase III subunit gamma/tau n=1 Tax=Pullulanibacillus sp. KACC 23026 TaxID=3028315 RepID=UPI0023AE8E9C|nr:DNA polymerase III subunit gamma/tau [Pullulanibacillus sp. KACC 23026]WEG12760.1 DNA polymerase III subunit gamma/tau [Pullulanibacillus sp. KACC 23026]
MVYQALYRVWRPQRFEDMAGQEHITQTLQNALAKEQFSHAYLFNGPRGTGKTSAAKIVAKAINCEHAPTSEPCNECPSCIAISEGRLPDVIEIDAASNNGVDEIREIRENVKYAPSSARYKVYIIDEVHMLSQGAFNALLKTLEEPPEHVIFILATTEPHKIPLTIISRCQRFDFKRIPLKSIVDRMVYIANEQGINASVESLTLIAKASDGGMRDALSILDQVVAFAAGEVTVNDVLEVTGLVSQNLISKVVHEVTEQNASEAVRAVNDLIDRGKDPEKFTEDLMHYYRDILLYKTSKELGNQLEWVQVDERFTETADTLEIEAIYSAIQSLNEAQQAMRWSSQPRILLEVTMVKLCHGNQLVERKPAIPAANEQEISGLLNRIESLETKLASLERTQSATSNSSTSTEQKRSRPAQKRATGGKGLSLPLNEMRHVLKQASKQELNSLRGSWADIMEKVRSTHVAAHAWLLESKPVASSESAFLLSFKYDFHCQMVLENKNNVLNMVEQIQKEVTGRSKHLYPIPHSEWEALRRDFIQHMDGGGSSDDDHPAAEEKDPLITEAEKLVGPDLLEIRD